ncbi:gas vesicle protein [Streptomyces sp. NPDC005805]|uniref:gas vesicle protein GvpO n=1 Tax=Streptomyces sp. NPDC005805 TaxID=3157068 RepID=UPI0033F62AB9
MATDRRSGSERKPAGKAGRTGQAGKAEKAGAAGKNADAAQAMRSAAGSLQELLGRPPESVSALRRTDDGWEADVEVLELERVPETTSVLGSYHVTLDRDGELVGYERTRRYTRGQIDRRD